MRLLPDKQYFQKIVEKHINETLRNNCFTRTKHYSLLFSSDYILKYSNGVTERMIVYDGEQSQIKHNNIDILCDTSQIKYEPFQRYQLPINIKEIPISQTIYKMEKKSDVTLYIEQFHTGIVRDIWFEIPDQLIDNIITLDVVCSFLEN